MGPLLVRWDSVMGVCHTELRELGISSSLLEKSLICSISTTFMGVTQLCPSKALE